MCAWGHTQPLPRDMMGGLPDKPTSEQIRTEAEKLRETAADLMEHAALLIEKSADLERRILARDKPKKGH
jgi:hypothetical protein